METGQNDGTIQNISQSIPEIQQTSIVTPTAIAANDVVKQENEEGEKLPETSKVSV
jgi:hypothetical protein